MTTKRKAILTVYAALSFIMVYHGYGSSPPQPVKNTDPPWYDPAPTNAPKLHIPEGSTNLAAGKPVTSSDMEPIIGELEQVTDGDKDWRDGSYVELLPTGKQYVQIDLLTNATIYAVWVWHYYWLEGAYGVLNADVPNDVVIQLGHEPTFSNNTTTVFNSDNDNSLGLGKGKDMPFGVSKYGKLVHIKPIDARFVRVYGNGGKIDAATKFVEIEVYGKPISDKQKKANK